MGDDPFKVPIILICIDPTKSRVMSYTVTDVQNDTIVPTNEILMPDLLFIDYSSDTEQRIIFLITEKPGYA